LIDLAITVTEPLELLEPAEVVELVEVVDGAGVVVWVVLLELEPQAAANSAASETIAVTMGFITRNSFRVA
jgi:hypothetical protein